jgi:hypothetical protein
MRKSLFAVTIMVLLGCPSLAQAQADFSTLAVRPGDIVYVKQASRVEVSGPVLTVSPASLTIEGYVFTPANTLQIDRRGDSVKNGAWIGALVLGGLCAAVCGQGVDDSSQLVPAVAVNAGLGALLGAFLDWGHTGRTTIFGGSRVTGLVPVVMRHLTALNVSVSF